MFLIPSEVSEQGCTMDFDSRPVWLNVPAFCLLLFAVLLILLIGVVKKDVVGDVKEK